jgi:hypothetical protein
MSDGQAQRIGLKKTWRWNATRGMGTALRGGGMAQQGMGMALKDGGQVRMHKQMAMGKKIF